MHVREAVRAGTSAVAFSAAALALLCSVGCEAPPRPDYHVASPVGGAAVGADSLVARVPEPRPERDSLFTPPIPDAPDPCRNEYTQHAATPVLPPSVLQTRDRLARAAAEQDWAAIDSLSSHPDNAFRFSFGDPDSTPVQHWLRYEGKTFLNDLAFVLATEPTPSGDGFVWPGWADQPWDQMNPRDQAAFACAAGSDAVHAMVSEARYIWVRTSILADGTWSYYVSGD